MLFSACGDVTDVIKTRSFNESSQVVADRVFTFAKECWEDPNKKIADVEVRGLTSGETYRTQITKEVLDEGTKIGAHYVIFDTNGNPKIQTYYVSLVTIIVSDDKNGSKATIKSFYKAAVNEVTYWLDNNQCRTK